MRHVRRSRSADDGRWRLHIGGWNAMSPWNSARFPTRYSIAGRSDVAYPVVGMARHLPRVGLAWFLPLFAATLTFAVGPSAAYALNPETAITQYGLDDWSGRDGLPSFPISDIEQSSDGYIYLATPAGLLRFDGVAFSRVDLGLPPESSRSVLVLSRSAQGGVWLGIGSPHLVRYRGNSTDFIGPARTDRGQGFPIVRETRDGSVWSSDGARLARFRNGVVESTLAIENVRVIRDTLDGTIWAGTWGGGLVRVQDGKATKFGAAEGLKDAFITDLAAARDGGLWVGTRDGLYRLKDGAFQQYGPREGLSHPEVRALLEDRDGNLWIGTAGGGLCRFRNGRFDTWRRHDGMIDDQILSLFEDDEGGLWVGARGTLARIRDTSFKLYTKTEGLPSETIVQVQPSRSGGVWVSTYGGGVSRVFDGMVTTYDERHGLLNKHIGAIHEDADGALWIASGDNELYRLHNGRMSRIDTGGRYVKSIGADAQGIVVGLSRTGLFRVEGSVVRPYTTDDGQTLTDPYIYILHTDRAGTLWIGTSKGLVALRGGTMKRFGKGEGLSGREVNAIHQSADGTLWLGTARGLESVRDDRGRMYTTHELLANNSISTLIDDGRGYLWALSFNGVLRVPFTDLASDVATPRVDLFGGQDGLRLAESRAPTTLRGCRSTDGLVWLPTTYGLAVVDPEKLIRDTKRPPVVIESVSIDGRTVLAKAGLRIPAGAEKVQIRYTALSYTRPERVTFRYRLKGFDRGWVDGGTQRVASYTKLPPGSYEMEVMAANSQGLWNERPISLSLVQESFFHQTLAFRLLLAGGGIVIGWGLHRLRVRRLKAQERELAAKVQQALAHIKTLRGLLPICANCKKIRNDQGLFIQIESYLQQHSHAEFSHSICPECLVALYPDYAASRDRDPSG
jgi:ligand-binding sensor domain-containing protein